jgi:hypothetical protein
MDGHDQINEGWGHSQQLSTRVFPEISKHAMATSAGLRAPLYPLEYASPVSNQSSSSPKSYLGDDRLITRPELNPTFPGSLTLSTPRHDSQSSSRHSFGTISLQDSASDRPLQQAGTSLGLAYNCKSQRTWIQNNPYIESRYYNELQPNQTAVWSSPSPFYQISPETSCSTSNFIAQPESAVQDNILPRWSTHPTTLLSRFENHGSLVHQPSNDKDFPSTCYLCNDPDTVLQDWNDRKVHYWTKHAPPAGSPGAWSSTRCLWQGCRLQKTFKSSRDWLYHTHTVHQKRYRCDALGCNVGPFGTQAMVERHYRTKHTKPKLCTKTGCQARKGTNLSRKDKLGEYEAMWHGPLVCEIADCPRRRIDGEDHGFSKQDELDKHMRRKHPYFQIRNSGN